MTTDMVIVKDLTKSYGGNAVLRGINLTIRQGEVFGLLGVNGAGKTTTIECIEQMRRPDSGHIAVNGTIGIQLQSTSLPETITAKEAMQLFSAWHKVPYRVDLLERFDMAGKYLNMTYRSLSTGRKRRLHLALALCHNPDILVLDEPTAGLDVEGRHALHAEIRRLKADGVTVLMATHDMLEAETLCDRIAILRGGVIAREGTPLELTAAANIQSRVIIKTRLDSLETFSEPHDSIEDGYASYACKDSAEFLLALLAHIRSAGDAVIDLRVERASIEDIFLDVAGEAK
jgi:ABC-2 type transport system ATP-binding protein